MKFCESFDLAMAASVNQDDLLEVLENEEGDTNSGESGEEDGTDADSDEESDGDDGEDVAGVDGQRRVVAWEYEPLPVGELGENVGDAEPVNAGNRLHANVEDW